MRKYIVAGNWKMNTTQDEALGLFTEVRDIAKDELKGSAGIVVFPPYVHLSSLNQLKKDSAVQLGAQNICWEEKGAFTGEISAAMVKSIGGTHVILGHSERRQYFAEKDEMLTKKLKLALAYSLTPVLCVGETKDERQSEIHIEVIVGQLKGTLFNLSAEEVKKVVLAYEPVWAIGTGLTASPEQAQEIHAEIRETVASQYGQALADDMTILYGGSCNQQNAASLFSQKDIDGGLIGGASLKSRDFIEIAKALETCKA